MMEGTIVKKARHSVVKNLHYLCFVGIIALGLMTIIATGGGGGDGDGGDSSANTSPTATITSPTDGSTFTEGDTITFTGSGTDAEDGTLTGSSLVWTSNIDGQIGTGTSFTRNDLSVGTHTITLTATDSDAATGSDSVTITVASADISPSAPSSPVKLIFIHHSCGENWLADYDGGLGIALRDNNYFVSDTYYGWGPDSIGDNTDIGHWWDWFCGANSDTYLQALYSESDPSWAFYSRLATDPGGENEIIMFKSCFPNSYLGGNPDDPPTSGDNPLRGQGSGSEHMTVANAKGIYNDILTYFASQQDKLFIAITAPPQVANDTDTEHAANARAFNNWLVNDWLDGYTHNNVAVFDFFNVLTSNGGDNNTNDVGQETGNHHRWWNGTVQHIQTMDNDMASYAPDDYDSHPTAAGNQKATAEFIDLLNIYYQRWQQTGGTAQLIQPNDLEYLGAFRLPDSAVEVPYEESWEYGGQALAYCPEGDPGGDGDGFPGSLFGTGHDVLNYVSEISIPVPSTSRDLEELNIATAIQGFHDVRGGLFNTLNEIPRVGMEYLPVQAGQTSGKLYLAWGQHFQDDSSTIVPSHAWCDLDLSQPDTQGAWWIGNESLYSTNGYIFAIPQEWAQENTGGRMLATGRFRDGGWSGMGPALFAYGPWLDGNPPAPDAHLSASTLLLYSNTRGDDTTDFKLEGYQHSDEWEGGAWITTEDKAAVVFVGTKGSGYLWYGFFSPGGDGMPCVEQGLTMPGCFNPDGTECPPELQGECSGHVAESRGWWSSRFDAQILFYDPGDLADVAAGTMEPYEPQPYAVLDIDEYLFLNSTVELNQLGYGDQRRYRLGETAYDRELGFLYVLERFADGAKPVVHVWSVQEG
jgi:hypothetical protein